MAVNTLDGNTLVVYVYVVEEDRPVGTREVMRGTNLSSPSVAFRHLQKLELMGLLEKNDWGYTVAQKTKVPGYVWIGKTLVPRVMFYSFFFVGALISEIAVVLLGYSYGFLIVERSFYLVIGITAMSLVLFFVEGIILRRKLKP